jgi:hypothetical protein
VFEILRLVLKKEQIDLSQEYEKSRLKSFLSDILSDLGAVVAFDFKELKMPD